MAKVYSVRVPDDQVDAFERHLDAIGLNPNQFFRDCIAHATGMSDKESATAILVSQVNQRMMYVVQRLRPVIKRIVDEEMDLLAEDPHGDITPEG